MNIDIYQNPEFRRELEVFLVDMKKKGQDVEDSIKIAAIRLKLEAITEKKSFEQSL